MKKSLLLAAASLAVIACSKRTIGEAPVDPNLPADNVVRFSSAASTATVSKAGLDASGHSTFEVDDTIGIYAVLDTKTLGAAPASVFPTNADFQYLKKRLRAGHDQLRNAGSAVSGTGEAGSDSIGHSYGSDGRH